MHADLVIELSSLNVCLSFIKDLPSGPSAPAINNVRRQKKLKHTLWVVVTETVIYYLII